MKRQIQKNAVAKTSYRKILFALWLSYSIANPAGAQSLFDEAQIKPEIIYRSAGIERNYKSVFHDIAHRNAVEQIYTRIFFKKSHNYQHDVVIVPAFRTVKNNPNNWETVLEQGYISTTLVRGLTLSLGKRTEYEGSGVFVNPSDLLNEDKDLFDDLYNNEGKLINSLSYFGKTWSTSLIYLPKRGKDREEGKYIAKFATDLLNTDVRFKIGYRQRIEDPAHDQEFRNEGLTYAASASKFIGDYFELHFDGRYQSSQRSALEEPERKYTSDKSISGYYDQTDPSMYYLGGSRIIFPGRKTLVLEAIQNQSGLNKDQFELYYASAKNDSLEAPSRLVGQNYGFVSFRDESLIKSSALEVAFLQNIQDGSKFVAGSWRYAISDVTAIELNPTWFVGDLNSEFGGRPFKSIFLLKLTGTY